MNASLPSRLLRRLASASLLAALASPLAAQQLLKTSCPAGSTFLIHPYFTNYSGSGIPLLKRTLDTALYPDAECNDGTPAVMYIRPANAAFAGNPIVTESDKWFIFTDGGGACHDADACLYDRWCSAGGAIFDRAGKMSSQGTFAAISGTGIFSDNPIYSNDFLDYNVVLIHYCSSDDWIGSQDYTGLTTSLGDQYDIRFQGEAIVNAVFDTLLAGPTSADAAVAAGYYSTALPSLADASRILLGGESAGGGGMRHHLDRLHYDVLLPQVTNPEVDIRGVIDAGTPPGLWDPTITWPGGVDPANYSDMLSLKEATALGFWGANNSALDQSCLDPVWTADHLAVGGTHPQICYDTTYTLFNHITTAVFLRQDINDPVASAPYSAWSLYPTPDAYWTAQFNQSSLFGTYGLGIGGLETPDGPSGVQGPHCNQHVAIQTNNGFFRHRVTGPGVPPLAFHDLLSNWVNGLAQGPDTVQVQTDNLGVGVYSLSFCP